MRKSDLMQYLENALPTDVVLGRYFSDSDLSQNSDEGYCSISFPETHSFMADNSIYIKIEVAHLDLITKQIEPVLEQQIENIIDQNKDFSTFTKGQVYSKSEKIYITSYEFDVRLEPEI